MYDIYDFDGTIYDGDSSVDFFLYALKINKKTWKYVPIIIWYTLLYIFKCIHTKKYKEVVFSFIKEIPNLEDFVCEFWETHDKKINDFFVQNIKEKKKICIISASPEFLLKPYVDRFKDVELIGTKMDKKGKIKGENCNKKEKVKRMYAWKKSVKIDKFYSDSIKDTPLAELSKEPYIVNHGKISTWNQKYFEKRKQTKVALFLFAFFFFLYTFLGIFLSYHFDFSENYDLLFNADTRRIIDDMSKIFGNHYRIKVHPLYVIIVQPIILLLTGLTADKILSCIIFSALISSLSVTTLYKIATMFIKNNKISVFISLFFGVTFTNFIFAAGLEVYNVAGLFLLLLWYQTIKMFQKEKIEKVDYFYYILLGVTSIGITVTNFVVFLITSFFLFIGKKIKLKKMIIIQLMVIIVSLLGSSMQNYVWHNTPTIHGDYKQNYEEEKSYIHLGIKKEKVKNVFEGAYINSIVSSELKFIDLKNGGKMIYFKKIGIESLIAILFYILILYYLIRNFKKNKLMNIGLICTLLFNSIIHLFYGNTTPFLYACHFVYVFFLLFIINYKPINKEKWVERLIAIILLLTFIINSLRFIKVVRLVGEILPPTYYRANFSTLTLVFMILFLIAVDMILCFILYINLRKFMVTEENKVKYFIISLISLVLIELSFIALHTTPHYAKILDKKLNIPIVLQEE